jgi:NAD(P)-dependent dehydrogenase (short-subunit alcohol dehydrogenase family)
LLWLANLDMTDTPAVRHVVDEAFNQLGKIDVVVSNAGCGLIGAAEEMTDEQVIHQINTNLIGPIQLVRAALPHLGGQAVFPGGSMYHASKWGIEGFIDAVGVALAHTWASVGVGSWLGNAAGIQMRRSGRGYLALRRITRSAALQCQADQVE